MPNVLSALRSLVKKKLSVTREENELVATLNRLLPSIGYKLMQTRNARPFGSSARAPMAPRSLACPHCDRRFAYPLHLGRHVSATHKNGVRRQRRVIARKSRLARSTRKAKKAA
jgi:hypothetical protein